MTQPFLEPIHITCSCLIRNGSVYRNGDILFTYPLPEWPNFLDAAYRWLNLQYPKFYKMDGLSKLGFLAAEVLLAGNDRVKEMAPHEKGVVLANASASLDTDIKYNQSIQEIASPALFVYTLPNIVIGEICIRHLFKGENAFFVFKSFDVTFMQQYIHNLFEGTPLKACLCGWVELLQASYTAAMFLVEKGAENQSIIFTAENLNQIYPLQNG
jgi:hypothetical protein